MSLLDVISPPSAWTLISQGAEARVWKVPVTVIVPTETVKKESENTSFTESSSTSSSLFLICKERFVKLYRHPELDLKLTKSRCRSEARLLQKCVKLGLSWMVPAVMKVDPPNLFLEFVNGPNLKTFLQQQQQRRQQRQKQENQHCIISQRKRPRILEAADNENENDDDDDDQIVSRLMSIEYDDLARRMGALIGQLHNIDIIHGDLTTSNMLLVMTTTATTTTATATAETIQNYDFEQHRLPTSKPSAKDDDNNNNNNSCHGKMDASWKLMLIDFGLGKSTSSMEEHAVDLYVLERALQSTHPELPSDFMDRLLHEYAKIIRIESKSGDVLRRLEDVRKRGRKRECFG
jgi:TP53 regulating kinase and related kinases